MYQMFKTLFICALLLAPVGVMANGETGKSAAKQAAQTQQVQEQAASDLININEAPAEELEKLPRIGPKMAQRIIDHRKQHEGFKKVEELMNVAGIGEKTFARLKSLITI